MKAADDLNVAAQFFTFSTIMVSKSLFSVYSCMKSGKAFTTFLTAAERTMHIKQDRRSTFFQLKIPNTIWKLKYQWMMIFAPATIWHPKVSS